MKKISIVSKELSYGIDVEEVFWIRQGILTKEQTRESRDEELIADILAYMLLETKPSSRSEFLDDYFGVCGDAEPSETPIPTESTGSAKAHDRSGGNGLPILDSTKLN